MTVLMPYLRAFAAWGLLCLIGQVLIDYTRLTPARILVGYVVAGVILGGLGIYLTKAIAEECRYAYRDGQNELTVIIDLPPDEPTANGQ